MHKKTLVFFDDSEFNLLIVNTPK